MAVKSVRAGEPLRLELQLSEGDDAKFVRAFLKDQAGVDLTTVDLGNVSRGLYINSSEAMPNIPQVTATYVVYEDSGFSIESCFTRGLDVFVLDQLEATQLPGVSELEGSIQSAGTVSGSVKSTGLSAEIKTNTLDGVIESPAQIDGEVDRSSTTGEIKTTIIKGDIK